MQSEEFVKKRLEKDLLDLKRMIALHFDQRKKDEEELGELKERIDKRKEMRERQIQERSIREKERIEKEKADKQLKLEAEEKRRVEEEAKKKEAMQGLALSFGGKQAGSRINRGGRAEREKKKKVLAERRKALNIDHLDLEKLAAKVNELYAYLCEVEEQRYDFEEFRETQKYQTVVTRVRCNMLMTKKQRKNVKRF